MSGAGDNKLTYPMEKEKRLFFDVELETVTDCDVHKNGVRQGTIIRHQKRLANFAIPLK